MERFIGPSGSVNTPNKASARAGDEAHSISDAESQSSADGDEAVITSAWKVLSIFMRCHQLACRRHHNRTRLLPRRALPHPTEHGVPKINRLTREIERSEVLGRIRVNQGSTDGHDPIKLDQIV